MSCDWLQQPATCPTAGKSTGGFLAGVRAGGCQAMPQLPGEGSWQRLPPPRCRARQHPKISSRNSLPACRQSMLMFGSFPAAAGNRLSVPLVWQPLPTWEGLEVALALLFLATSQVRPAPNVASPLPKVDELVHLQQYLRIRGLHARRYNLGIGRFSFSLYGSRSR